MDIVYSTDGILWWRTEFAEQCAAKYVFGQKCQGVEGHEGECWAYDQKGHLIQWEKGEGSTHTPPDHKSYIDPLTKNKEYYMKFCDTKEVTDKQLIAKLEKDEPPEEDASIDRPCSDDEIEFLQQRIKGWEF